MNNDSMHDLAARLAHGDEAAFTELDAASICRDKTHKNYGVAPPKRRLIE